MLAPPPKLLEGGCPPPPPSSYAYSSCCFKFIKEVFLFLEMAAMRCANTLSCIHGLYGSYDTEAWKYYIINLRFSKPQQIFRPRIILLIQVLPKKCIPTGLRQGSNPRRLQKLSLAIKRHLVNQLRHYVPPKKQFHETMLSLISLNDPSDRAVLLRCSNTLSYIHGLSGLYDTEARKYYIIIFFC